MSLENDAVNGKIAIVGHDGHRAKMHYIEMWFETVMHTIWKMEGREMDALANHRKTRMGLDDRPLKS